MNAAAVEVALMNDLRRMFTTFTFSILECVVCREKPIHLFSEKLPACQPVKNLRWA
jgi:hypothetical protein